VARTGEIGLIKIVRLDYRGDETRVEFLCGGRALRDYKVKNDMANRLASMLTVGQWELDQAVERLQAAGKQLRRDLRQARKRLLQVEVDELAATAVVHGHGHELYRIVWRVWEPQGHSPGKSPQELRALAQELARRSIPPGPLEAGRSLGIVALLSSIGERTHLCFARAEGVDLDVAALLRDACAQLGGKGGGRPHLAQGSAPPADAARVESVISSLLKNL
jgi:alanyl-tRNA synthetase